MKLSEILNGLDYTCSNFTDCEIKDIAYDSRKCDSGILFVCLVGAMTDGHKYIQSAYDKGSRVFLCEKEVDLPSDAVIIFTENTRSALAKISCNFFRHPSKELKVIGITGTKGKTTTAHIVQSVLNEGGVKTGIIGTVGSFFNGRAIPTVNTTPESYELQKIFRTMKDEGCEAVVIEVSSLGLKHYRVDGTEFFCGAFTNLYPDHIGTNEHDSFEEYSFWKTQLFPMCRQAIVNIDDSFSDEIIRHCTDKVITYGCKADADYVLESHKKVKAGNVLATEFNVNKNGTSNCFTIALPGAINAHNALIAVALADIFGIDDEKVKKGLEKVSVKGRCEILRDTQDITIIIDYAHNGISLENIINTAKEYEHNRIITLFGSVGGRTECRREELGLVSGRMSDFTVITSDDPDFEDPRSICEEIASYCEKAGGEFVIIPDRGEAINYAVKMAESGDILILAGKGHEEYMKINGQKVPFNERDEIAKAFREKERR